MKAEESRSGPDFSPPGASWHRFYPIAFALLLAVAICCRLTNGHAGERTPDEKTYIAYATRVAEMGPGAIAQLVSEYNKTQGQWIYPPPTRVGYILLVAATAKLTGSSVESAGIWLSFSFSLLAFLFTALIGVRFFDRWAVLVALAFFAVSPVDLVLAGRIWQDAIVEGLGLLMIYICLEASLATRPRQWRASFWTVAFLFLLIKESAVVIYGCCVAWLLLQLALNGNSKRWRNFGITAMIAGAVGLLSVGTEIWLSGGLTPFLQIYGHMTRGLAGNDYAWRYQAGPWYSLPLGFWILSPLTTLLCAVGVGRSFVGKNSVQEMFGASDRQWKAGQALAWFICAVLVAATIPEGFKSLRYVSVVQGPIALIAGAVAIYFVVQLARAFPPGRGIVVEYAFLVILAWICFADYRRYQRIFVRGGLNDPAIVRIVDAEFIKEAPLPVVQPPVIPARPSREDAVREVVRSVQSYRRGAYAEALTAAQEAIRLRPDYPEAWNNIGAAYNALGRFSEGAAACEKALSLKPDFPLARANLQYAQQRLKQNDGDQKNGR